MLRRLILIDRDRRPRESLERVLKENFDLLHFESFERAIEEIRDIRPHGIIIIDDDHPEELLRTLRSLEPAKELPLIVVSARTSPEREVEVFQAGADEFIVKGTDPEVFKIRLLSILRSAFAVRRLSSKIEEMNTFLRTVTHDLKNPIGSIVSCVELLQLALDSSDLGEARELTATIQKSAQHALDFIQDLLVLLRNGSPLQSVAEIPMNEVIAESIDLVAERIKGSGSVVEIPDNLPRVVGDRKRLVHAFSNLFSNAIKFVAKGVVPHVRLNVIETPHANTFVVEDNGFGIRSEDTKRIFQPFVRLAEASEIDGTGLGLAIVERVVHAHEGDVFVRSRPGIGSEFYVVLPTALSFASEPVEAKPAAVLSS